MYTVPQLYGTRNYLQPVEADTIAVCLDECTLRGLPCDEDVHGLCAIYMAENGWTLPGDQMEAVDLYVKLRAAIMSDL